MDGFEEEHCDEMLLEVCWHKLPDYIEAAHIGTYNWTYHSERATNNYITRGASGI